MNLSTKQLPYKVLKTLGVDDTALVWSGASQTVDRHEIRGSTVESDDIPQNANGAVVIFHGTDAANEVMNWMLVGWAENGPAEYIANGTATLGTQRVNTGTALEMWAHAITITAQNHIYTVSVADSGNNRIAKLCFDMGGFAHIAAIIQKDTAASTGAKIRYF